MKSLFKIICRYSVTAGVIIFVLLLSNAAAFLFWGYKTMENDRSEKFDREAVEEIGGELYRENNVWKITETGMAKVEEMECQWMMALDQQGSVVWEWRLPEEFARSYSLQDVAGFSRWYLHDYPVAVWRSGTLLLVTGLDMNTIMRISEMLPISNISGIPAYISLAFTVNLVLILFFVLFLGYRFYRALKPVGKGIESLVEQEPLCLREKGMAGDLARKLNRVSDILQEQKKKLSRRDQARTEWISGVSHDIRTPLALILGYSDRLKKDESLSKDARKSAEIICGQSLIIRQLIDDLNLTSKLAYQAQPLKKSLCSPAQILRECAADMYNEETGEEVAEENTDIELIIDPETEKVKITADAGLLKRALRNLIGNSVRHNPGGCRVTVRLYIKEKQIVWEVRDSGKGIPEAVVENMDSQTEKIHIMGLRLVRQIAKAHGGDLVFCRRETGCYDAEMVICMDKNTNI